MAVDTFVVYVGVYADVAAAEADYEAVKDLHTKAGLIDAYDAAVIERRAGGKVKIVKKHETPTRVGGVLGGGVGLATGLVVALFPFAAIGGGLLAVDHRGRRGAGRAGRSRGGRDEPQGSEGARRAPGRRAGRPGGRRRRPHRPRGRGGHAPRGEDREEAARGRHRRDRAGCEDGRSSPGVSAAQTGPRPGGSLTVVA